MYKYSCTHCIPDTYYIKRLCSSVLLLFNFPIPSQRNCNCQRKWENSDGFHFKTFDIIQPPQAREQQQNNSSTEQHPAYMTAGFGNMLRSVRHKKKLFFQSSRNNCVYHGDLDWERRQRWTNETPEVQNFISINISIWSVYYSAYVCILWNESIQSESFKEK